MVEGEEEKDLNSWGGSYGASLSRVSLLSREGWSNDSNGPTNCPEKLMTANLSQSTYLPETPKRKWYSVCMSLVQATVHWRWLPA